MGMNNFTGTTPPPAGPTGPQVPTGTYAQQPQHDMSDILVNYNDKFKSAGNTLFRDAIVQQSLGVLTGKNKPNVLLIGPAGTGKTKIAEDIAYRLANDDPIIPDKLKDHVVYELPLSMLVAGSGVMGELETKVNDVCQFAEDPSNKAIIFIDEIHQLTKENDSVYGKIAQILKPALARGKMKVIGATTNQEAKTLLNDTAFNRRFSRIIVDEFNRDQTIEILKHLRGSFIQFHNNRITLDDGIMELIAQLADEFHEAGTHRPDSAITLLDRSIGAALVNRKIMEQQAANDPALLAAIQSVPFVPITEKLVKTTALQLMTGNSRPKQFDEQELKDALSPIKGQDESITEIIREVKRRDLGLLPKNVPLTLLLAGVSGCGKTEVTKLLSNYLTGSKPIILNMTEYTSPASIARIIGAPPGYVGYSSNAELPFDSLESNPYQVVLLDEFEKADKSVQRLFMSAFDEGYIKTSKGTTIDFSRSIIVATTNAGHKERKASLGFAPVAQTTKISATIKELSHWFDTELLNRFHSILTFNELSRDTYKEILAGKYREEVKRIKADHPKLALLDEIPDDKLDELADDTFVPAFGARPATKTAHAFIEEQI
ncbi:MAG: ATP-dependent Clp protease ATP-binding subunit [Clostridia bacterium]|nr:ATP-dependent Clp protease ATP-binding subunit [Clostridia bacterium]